MNKLWNGGACHHEQIVNNCSKALTGYLFRDIIRKIGLIDMIATIFSCRILLFMVYYI